VATELCASCGDDEVVASEACVACNQALCKRCYDVDGGWCAACVRREERAAGVDDYGPDPDAAYDRWRDDGDGPLAGLMARLS